MKCKDCEYWERSGRVGFCNVWKIFMYGDQECKFCEYRAKIVRYSEMERIIRLLDECECKECKEIHSEIRRILMHSEDVVDVDDCKH